MTLVISPSCVWICLDAFIPHMAAHECLNVAFFSSQTGQSLFYDSHYYFFCRAGPLFIIGFISIFRLVRFSQQRRIYMELITNKLYSSCKLHGETSVCVIESRI